MCSRRRNEAHPPAAAGATRARAAALAAACAALALAGCGNKESPKPPPQIIPVRTLDLQVAQRGHELMLTFTYPTTTIAGAALGDLEAVEFWELVREMRLVAPPASPPPAAEATEPAPTEPSTGTQAAAGTDAAADAAPATRTTAPKLEDLATIDNAEFLATAKLRLALKQPELDDAISGSKITVRFPLEPLAQPEPEAAAGEEAPEAGAQEPGEAAPAAAATPETSATPEAAEAAAPADAAAAADAAELPEPPPAAPQAGDTAAAAGDDEGPLHKVYLFAVKTVPARGLTSSFSNVVKIVQRRPPPPPAEFEVQPGAAGITLSWKADESDRTQGYRVYRRAARARAYAEPLRALPAGSSRFVDATAEFGQRYIYAVTAVGVADPLVESAIAAEHEVDYEDRFPPPPPANPIALPEAGAVRLIWDEVEDKDLLGYVVERAEGEGPFAAIHEEPITDLELTDRGVVSGREYRYRIYAVDAKGNRGRPSEAIEVRAP